MRNKQWHKVGDRVFHSLFMLTELCLACVLLGESSAIFVAFHDVWQCICTTSVWAGAQHACHLEQVLIFQGWWMTSKHCQSAMDLSSWEPNSVRSLLRRRLSTAASSFCVLFVVLHFYFHFGDQLSCAHKVTCGGVACIFKRKQFARIYSSQGLTKESQIP